MFYTRFVDAFEEQISSAVEKAICKKLGNGILKVDSFLHSLPKEVQVDDNASYDVTFVENPTLSNSSIGLKINGLFRARELLPIPEYHFENSPSASCTDPSKMFGITLDEAVFNSALALYYNVGSNTILCILSFFSFQILGVILQSGCFHQIKLSFMVRQILCSGA